MDIISPELIFVRGPNTLLSELYSSYKDYGLTILFNDPKKDENTLNKPIERLVKNNLMASIENFPSITNITDMLKNTQYDTLPVDTKEQMNSYFNKAVTINPNEDSLYRHYGQLTIHQMEDKYTCQYIK